MFLVRPFIMTLGVAVLAYACAGVMSDPPSPEMMDEGQKRVPSNEGDETSPSIPADSEPVSAPFHQEMNETLPSTPTDSEPVSAPFHQEMNETLPSIPTDSEPVSMPFHQETNETSPSLPADSEPVSAPFHQETDETPSSLPADSEPDIPLWLMWASMALSVVLMLILVLFLFLYRKRHVVIEGHAVMTPQAWGEAPASPVLWQVSNVFLGKNPLLRKMWMRSLPLVPLSTLPIRAIDQKT